MTITKQQALETYYGQEFHYTGKFPCQRHVGPRGGIRETITHIRVSGTCKTWKTRPTEFRLPVKYGLYESGAIEHWNANDWHSPKDCPP